MAACVAALSLAASASPAAASVTIGELAPPGGAPNCSGGSFDDANPVVNSSGPTYVVPSSGGITSWRVVSWSHEAGSGEGQNLTLKFFRHASGLDYSVVGHDGPRPLIPSATNTFAVTGDLTVKPGDLLGLHNLAGPMTQCFFTGLAEELFRPDGLGDGQTGTFTHNVFAERLNISAALDPDNSFSLGATIRNKKKGTATLTLNPPNPGELSASGKGVKVSSAGAMISKAVQAGPAQLLIKAKGKKQKALNENGKVEVKPKITYTPTGGNPNTQSVKVKLKKKL